MGEPDVPGSAELEGPKLFVALECFWQSKELFHIACDCWGLGNPRGLLQNCVPRNT